MNIIIVITTVPYYAINMTVFKLILQPDNKGLRDWFQYTAIYQEDRCSLFRILGVQKERRGGISNSRVKQKLHKCV